MVDIDSIIDEIINEYKKKRKQDIISALTFANNEMYDELNELYDTFIRKFYQYETQSYIRHWEGIPGTKKGTNLYYGKKIKKRISQGLPYLEIEFDAEKMAGGYEHDSADIVLNQVMSGGLEIHGSKGGIVYERSWTGSFHGKYFAYTGKMEDAISRFYDSFEDNLTSAFMIKWRSMGWE